MSILFDLRQYFRDKPENIATRAASFILKQPEALQAMNKFLQSRLGWRVVIDDVNAQVPQGENGQPDLEGKADGKTVFFGEVKFGAPLTDNQPISYLNCIPHGGLLLFIAPKDRASILWIQLREKLGKGKQEGLIDTIDQDPLDPYLIKVDGKFLALVTGSDLINALLENVHKAGETWCDIRQLQALWQAYDKPDLPVVTEAISTDCNLATIIVGLSKLPDKVAKELILLPGANRAPRLVASGSCTYVDDVRIGQLKGWVIYSPPNWKAYGCSPIWFELRNNGQYVPDLATWQVFKAVFAQRAHKPEPLASMNYPDAIAVPLKVIPAAESEVVSDIINQLRSMAGDVEHLLSPKAMAE